MTRGWIACVFALVLVVVSVGSRAVREPEAKSVETRRLVVGNVHPSILASGVLTYEKQITLMSEVVAQVREVYVKAGDTVNPGQLLMRTDASSLQSAVEQLQASLAEADLNVRRQRLALRQLEDKAVRYDDLFQHGFINVSAAHDLASDRDQARVQLAAAQQAAARARAQLNQARQVLGKTEIRSPIAGKVTDVPIHVGETAIPSAAGIAGGSLLTIADTSKLLAEVNVDESEIGQIAPGQSVSIVPAAFPDRPIEGTVDEIPVLPRLAGGKAHSYPVRVRLTQADLTFRPGMSVRAEIRTGRDDAPRPIVPLQAIQYERDSGGSAAFVSVVYVLEGGTARRRVVQTGTADDANIQIVAGLQTSDVVCIGPAKTLRFLRDGERVAVAADASARTAR